jgi:hypothetical protein
MVKVVTMVECELCRKDWIQEGDLVCEKCAPKLLGDMAVMDLFTAVENVCKLDKNYIREQRKLITELRDRINTILE